jgi:hypothetical protein
MAALSGLNDAMQLQCRNCTPSTSTTHTCTHTWQLEPVRHPIEGGDVGVAVAATDLGRGASDGDGQFLPHRQRAGDDGAAAALNHDRRVHAGIAVQRTHVAGTVHGGVVSSLEHDPEDLHSDDQKRTLFDEHA